MKSWSLRTKYVLSYGLVVVLALGAVSYLGISVTKAAYLDLALRDVTYMTENLAGSLDHMLDVKATEAEYMADVKANVQALTSMYFERNGMAGYAIFADADGNFLYHPKKEGRTSLLNDYGDQGKALLSQAKAASFNGTVFYRWQNAGEKGQREKFAVLRPLPHHPNYVVWVTAYTADDLLAKFKTVQVQLMAAGAVAVLIVLVLVFLNTNRIVKAIHAVQGRLAQVATGDLSEADGSLAQFLPYKDEIGEMARTLKQTVSRLRQLVAEVHTVATDVAGTSQTVRRGSEQSADASRQVADAIGSVASGAGVLSQGAADAEGTTKELQQAIAQVAQGAQEQSHHIQQTVEVVTRLSDDMLQLVSLVTQVQAATDANGTSARDGLNVAVRARAGIDEVKEAVSEAAARLAHLSDSTRQIGQITATITEIAEQTNLLALNAAIEAARAGDAGRGFAVVADEVRKLAERSAKATGEIGALVATIAGGVNEVSAAMTRSSQVAAEGSNLVHQSSKAFEDVAAAVTQSVDALKRVTGKVSDSAAAAGRSAGSISSVAAIVEENTAATEEMSAAAQHVQTIVQRAADVARENAAATQQVSAAVEEVSAAVDEMAASARALSDLSDRLQRVTAQFRT